MSSFGFFLVLYKVLMSRSVEGMCDEDVRRRVVSEVASSILDSLVITSIEYSVFRRLSPLRSFR